LLVALLSFAPLELIQLPLLVYLLLSDDLDLVFVDLLLKLLPCLHILVTIYDVLDLEDVIQYLCLETGLLHLLITLVLTQAHQHIVKIIGLFLF
jgi:hypothetical protein